MTHPHTTSCAIRISLIPLVDRSAFLYSCMHPSPQSQAIDAVHEFVKEAGGAAARELSPAERRDVMDVILQPYLEAEASAKWEWRDYDRKQHTVNIEKRFANRGAPPSNEVRVQATLMCPFISLGAT